MNKKDEALYRASNQQREKVRKIMRAWFDGGYEPSRLNINDLIRSLEDEGIRFCHRG